MSIFRRRRNHDSEDDKSEISYSGVSTSEADVYYSDHAKYSQNEYSGSEYDSEYDSEFITTDDDDSLQEDESSVDDHQEQEHVQGDSIVKELDEEHDRIVAAGASADASQERFIESTNSTVIHNLSSAEPDPNDVTQELKEKRIQEHREYRRKLAEDPSFVPYLGLFWSHDDRYREDALAQSDSQQRTDDIPTKTSSFMNKGQHVQKKTTQSEYDLDPLMHKKWDHSGWEELLRIEEEEERRKREFASELDSKQYYNNDNYRRNRNSQRHRNNFNYRRNFPEASSVNSYKESARSTSPTNIQSHEFASNTWKEEISQDAETAWISTVHAQNNNVSNSQSEAALDEKVMDNTAAVNDDNDSTTSDAATNHADSSFKANDNHETPASVIDDDGWGAPAGNTDESFGWNEPVTEISNNTAWGEPVTVVDINKAAEYGWGVQRAVSDNWGEATNETDNWGNSDRQQNDWQHATNTEHQWNDTVAVETKTDDDQLTQSKQETDVEKDASNVTIPDEEKASSSWSTAELETEVRTTPSSWTWSYKNNTWNNVDVNRSYRKTNQYTEDKDYDITKGASIVYTFDENNNFVLLSSLDYKPSHRKSFISSPTSDKRYTQRSYHSKDYSESQNWNRSPKSQEWNKSTEPISVNNSWNKNTDNDWNKTSTNGWDETVIKDHTNWNASPADMITETESWPSVSHNEQHNETNDWNTTISETVAVKMNDNVNGCDSTANTTTSATTEESQGWGQVGTTTKLDGWDQSTTNKEWNESQEQSNSQFKSNWEKLNTAATAENVEVNTEEWNDKNDSLPVSAELAVSDWDYSHSEEITSQKNDWDNTVQNGYSNHSVITNDQPRSAIKGHSYLSQRVESYSSFARADALPSPISDDNKEEQMAMESYLSEYLTNGKSRHQERVAALWTNYDQNDESDVEIILEAEDEPDWAKNNEQILGMTGPDSYPTFEKSKTTHLQQSSTKYHNKSELSPNAKEYVHHSPISRKYNHPKSSPLHTNYNNKPHYESSNNHSEYPTYRHYNRYQNNESGRANKAENWRQKNKVPQHDEQPQQFYTGTYPKYAYNGAAASMYMPMIPTHDGNIYAISYPIGHHHNEASTRQPEYYAHSTNGVPLPPGYEANGTVYYGHDPSAAYSASSYTPYYYYPVPMATRNQNYRDKPYAHNNRSDENIDSNHYNR
ncbi:MAG: hypothetical protein EXX96DRAFT_560150 [Benjaminiella poitrasii]|nr:MAG: hypothetical protein EXX96DRAFT_560150 [Benjaminiella poitrasii]